MDKKFPVYNKRAPADNTRGSSRTSSFNKGVDKKNTSTGKGRSGGSANVDNKTIVADLKGVDKTLAEAILDEVLDR